MDMLNQLKRTFKESHICVFAKFPCIKRILGNFKILRGTFICKFQNVT